MKDKRKAIEAIGDEAASYATAVVTVPANAITRADDKDKVTISPEGCAFIRAAASNGESQSLIAARLGISKTTLQQLFKRDEAARLAYEFGHSEMEAELVGLLVAAARKGSFIPALFLLKSRHGYQEGAPPPATTNNIVITLPGAMSEADYLTAVNEPRPKVTRPVLPALGHNPEVSR